MRRAFEDLVMDFADQAGEKASVELFGFYMGLIAMIDEDGIWGEMLGPLSVTSGSLSSRILKVDEATADRLSRELQEAGLLEEYQDDHVRGFFLPRYSEFSDRMCDWGRRKFHRDYQRKRYQKLKEQKEVVGG